jgi:hypothetical protein
VDNLDQLQLIIPLPLQLPQLPLLFDLLLQPVPEYLDLPLVQLDQRGFGFFDLSFSGLYGLFQCAVMSKSKLDQLLLQPSGLILLRLQFVLMLEGKLFLLAWKPE